MNILLRMNNANLKPSIEVYDKETDTWNIVREMEDVPRNSCVVPIKT